MAESRDPQDPRAPRTPRGDPRRTQQLPAADPYDDVDPYGDPVNPGWRSGRTTTRRSARAVPTSRQEFALWLQYGGWRFLLAALAIVLAGVVLYMLSRSATPLPSGAAGDDLPFEIRVSPSPLLPTVTPGSLTPTVALSPTAPVGAQLRVTGTGAEGLFLRGDTVVTPENIIMTLPEGTVVTVIGADKVVDGRVWKNVRAPDNREGWAASDWLTPVE